MNDIIEEVEAEKVQKEELESITVTQIAEPEITVEIVSEKETSRPRTRRNKLIKTFINNPYNIGDDIILNNNTKYYDYNNIIPSRYIRRRAKIVSIISSSTVEIEFDDGYRHAIMNTRIHKYN